MSKLLEWVIVAAIGVIVPALLYALFRAIGWIAGIKRSVDAMREGGKKRTEETQIIVRAILDLSDTQRATLEAIRDGKCNGNITGALGKLNKTDESVENMLIERVG